MQDKYKIVKIRERNKYLEVYWCDNHISKFHFLWLRDNCPTAFHKDTRMRKFNILSVTRRINLIMLSASISCPEDFANWFETNNSVDLRSLLRDIEIVFIEAALNRNNGNTSEAAKDLKLLRTTLIEKVKKYGL